MLLKDRTFIISGGASGLGLATAREFIQHGAYVAILDLNKGSGDAAASSLEGRGSFFECDVGETESIATAVKGVMAWVGETGRPLGGVVAAAGVGAAAKIIDKNSDPFSIENFDFVVRINLRGTVDLLRQTLPHIIKNEPTKPDGERGVLILVSSSSAFDGQMGQVAYGASKGAIRSLTLPLTRDLSQYGVRVVTLAPSLFRSGMTENMGGKVRMGLEKAMEFPKREGRGEEFAHACRMVVENVMLNGSVIRLDGGMRMPSRL